jgi:uncharacterized protein (TIGR03083 family)
MGDERETNERDREQLQAALADEREALLAVASGVDEGSLARPTRNPDWTVRDVLAHVLASDADLVWLLEEAIRSGTRIIGTPGLEGHQREMTRWAGATPPAFARELRERGNRWRELLAALPDAALSIAVSGDWWPQDALSGSGEVEPEISGGVRELFDVIADWRGHDAQHAEDVRLTLADGGSDERR